MNPLQVRKRGVTFGPIISDDVDPNLKIVRLKNDENDERMNFGDTGTRTNTAGQTDSYLIATLNADWAAFDKWNTTAEINTDPSLFIIANNGITVNEPGYYRLSVSMYSFATTNFYSQALQFAFLSSTYDTRQAASSSLVGLDSNDTRFGPVSMLKTDSHLNQNVDAAAQRSGAVYSSFIINVSVAGKIGLCTSKAGQPDAGEGSPDQFTVPAGMSMFQIEKVRDPVLTNLPNVGIPKCIVLKNLVATNTDVTFGDNDPRDGRVSTDLADWTAFLKWNTSPELITDTSTFTVDSSGITINEVGFYIFHASFYLQSPNQGGDAVTGVRFAKIDSTYSSGALTGAATLIGPLMTLDFHTSYGVNLDPGTEVNDTSTYTLALIANDDIQCISQITSVPQKVNIALTRIGAIHPFEVPVDLSSFTIRKLT